MTTSPIKFGTSGWRGLIAEDFTFANVRLAIHAISEHLKSKAPHPTVLVGYDTRFYSEEFSALAVRILQEDGIKTLLCETFTPTPTIAYEIQRRKLDGAINFTASHNPAQYHGLKFSGADAGPALPEVTKDIEARVAKILGPHGINPYAEPDHDAKQGKDSQGETVNLRKEYLKRINELVRFDVIKKAKLSLVTDALHGCGAGYLDKALIDHGIRVKAIRTERDCLFEGSGPDVSQENLVVLGKAIKEFGAKVGLATDGDADRFGIVDGDGTWIQPNLILALVYDYLVETRGWKMSAARSVASTQMVDAVAKSHGQTTYQTPVGFKYIGQLIREDKIAFGGEESAGLTIRGHIPEKDGILAGLLVAEMTAARGASLGEQIRAMFKKLGREFHPIRENLHLSDEQKANTIRKVAVDASTLLGRKVVSVDRTDGAKFLFEDGSWILVRLSGTEPIVRLYVEAESAAATEKLRRDAADWILKGG
ncbi:MAG TPA: phosphoglucomutase/phosphomannomutase family protein [Candidatus Sulfotelmatobacter sp.]|nr:phosphoglucomutase/phosphomannomutase family protein [Candidatus Sulfotelmatobacter sp.]